MRNILAIAQKELKSYFSSPIGYVLIGLWVLLYGYFYISILAYFVRASMMGQMGQGPQAVNVNQDLIRPLFYNVTIMVLFVLPGVTMRTTSRATGPLLVAGSPICSQIATDSPSFTSRARYVSAACKGTPAIGIGSPADWPRLVSVMSMSFAVRFASS